MRTTTKIQDILSHYESDNPGTKKNLASILMHGKLSGTGKLLILPVDQGFEHGPARSFAVNPEAYDPFYHYSLAIEAGLSAYAAPLGMLEVGASTFAATGCGTEIFSRSSRRSILETKPISSLPGKSMRPQISSSIKRGAVAPRI